MGAPALKDDGFPRRDFADRHVGSVENAEIDLMRLQETHSLPHDANCGRRHAADATVA